VPELKHEGATELVTVGGAELFTRRFGDSARPLLIVVHGGPTWDHPYLLPAVAELADLAHASRSAAPGDDVPGESRPEAARRAPGGPGVSTN
jgi:hypothetical protein